MYLCFFSFVYTCPKPVIFVIPDKSLSHSSKYGYPFGIHFGVNFPIIPTSLFFILLLIKRGKSKTFLDRGTCDTSQVRGEPGETQGTPRGNKGSRSHFDRKCKKNIVLYCKNGRGYLFRTRVAKATCTVTAACAQK